jgi:hypothetical protein
MKTQRIIRNYQTEIKRINSQSDSVYRAAVNRWENRKCEMKTES